MGAIHSQAYNGKNSGKLSKTSKLSESLFEKERREEFAHGHCFLKSDFE